MPDIKISYTAPGADVVTARIDGSPVSFSGTAKAGEAEVTVPAGSHRLRYTIEGLPGTSYTIKIAGSSPDKSITDTIGSTGVAAGSIPFEVEGLEAVDAVAVAAASITAAATAIGIAAAARRRSSRKKAASKKAASKKAAKKPKKGGHR